MAQKVLMAAGKCYELFRPAATGLLIIILPILLPNHRMVLKG